jgi:ABC-type branched-subunit amino acid transport system substrate-binding protein
MKKTLILTIAILLFTLCLSAKETIQVGVVLPLSGNQAYLGEMARDGLLLKLKEVEGQTKYNYQIIFEDDAFEVRQTNTAILKFKNIDKVDVVCTMWGRGSEIALPLLKGSHILHLSTDRWFYSTATNDYVVGNPLDSYMDSMIALLEKYQYRRVAFLGNTDQGETLYEQLLRKRLKEANIELVDDTSLSQDARDVRTWVLKIRDLKPDAIIDCTVMPLGQIFRKQMKDIQYHTPIICADSTCLEVDPAYVNGECMIYPIGSTESWSSRFAAVYHKDPSYPAPQYYNTITSLIAACEHCDGKNKPTTSQIADGFKFINNLAGATGPLNFSPPNNVVTPVSYYFVKGSKAKTVSLGELYQLQHPTSNVH